MTTSIRMSSDVGGTFTDLVCVKDGHISVVKSDTTVGNFEQGVLNAIGKSGANLHDVVFFAHGSTVVINAITERKGVKTALITTRGFRDVLEIARGNNPDIYNACYQKPRPFVERALRFELTERLDSQGQVITAPVLSELDDIIAQLKAEGVEAIAVAFLHAYLNPSHEREAVQHIKALWPQVDVIASHEVCNEWREYERTNTAVLSAYVLPPTKAYLQRLQGALQQEGLQSSPFIMQSNGGIETVSAVIRNPVTLIESGPVGGMLAAATYGALVGENDILALDIGGTTAKCTLIRDGKVPVNTDYIIEKSPKTAGYPIKTPVVDIVEIGNGGGSQAWVDAAGSLHVGPQSAGSYPGPVAYGRGGVQPTTTDANLLTGRINPDLFVGGTVTPDIDAARQACALVGESLGGLDSQQVARGILRIANANMSNALKLVSVSRGHDPRRLSLMAFGGGGAMHAVSLARELNIPKVIIPPHSAVFSAWGMLMIDLRRDYLQTRLLDSTVAHAAELSQAFHLLAANAVADFANEGYGEEQVRLECYAELRYQGQEHTVKVAYSHVAYAQHSEDAATKHRVALETMNVDFHKAHEREYSFELDLPIEIVSLHLVAFAEVEKSPINALPNCGEDASPALKGEREVDFDECGIHLAKTYYREELCAGMKLTGPAIIEESGTTTPVYPGNRVTVDAYGGLHIELTAAEANP
ncbi:hydantoinase/oxoprolinase family protein [Microbulbifer sp. CAU 1566]|uniref:hydantoinase/oxoprolinase family protein n=1 Tax=Microbulbifer sp. CAU 1566 TaxID=2933269 RepID=UPI00200326E7|nr:hydantoinase/oxoprolinase family protein [Microbulbifer sp. CAU 1566]MCK7597672.1 hydantoinase/oxoprolinase family protein [Microbulbifer sp. CAU 1566]